MKLKRIAISRVVAVVVLIVLVVVAAGAYFLLSAPTSGGKTTSSSTSQTPQTTTTTSASSASLTSSSSSASSTSSFSTSMTPSFASSTTTTSATTQTTSCSSLSTSILSNSSAGQEIVGFFSSYSSMSMNFQGTKNGVSRTGTLSFSVVYESSTTFKVSFSHTVNGKSSTGTLWILKNGTTLAVERGGKNSTGSTAGNFVLGHFSDLDILYSFATQESPITSYFHSNGTTTANIGASPFTVTDYVMNTTPETLQVCNEGTAVLDAYSVYLGTPKGANLEMITSANFSGTLTSLSGTIITLDFSYQLTGLTVA